MEPELVLRPLPPRERSHRRRFVAGARRPLAIAGSLLVITGGAAAAAVHLRSPGPAALPESPPIEVGTAAPPTTNAVDYAAGVVVRPTGRWQIGAPGDVVTVGDWDCDGEETLALLRPATGAVYAFLAWAAAGRDEVGDRLGVVAGATGLETVDADGDGCGDLVVHRDDGDAVILHPPDHL